MEKINRKIVGGLEMGLMIVAVFAFSYGVSASNEFFSEVADYDNLGVGWFGQIVAKVVEILGKPIIRIVAAEEINTTLDSGWILSEDTTVSTYNISSSDFGAGCCGLTTGGKKCATSVAKSCVSSAPFAEGALCASTSFCREGCCYDEVAGIYDRGVLKSDCKVSWVADANCNLPGARLGCCVLGDNAIFETRGQCVVDSLVRVLGSRNVVDWRLDLNEGQCLLISSTQKKGACVLSEGKCKFTTEGDCFNYGGDFSDGYLCTSKSLGTACEMTEQTTCVDGKDGVYFLDSCGNVANIYDSDRVGDVSYWDRVISLEDSCDDGDGNANSDGCGNCNRFLGGICDSVTESRFDVDYGNFYCRDTSCMFDGVEYKNGESWCVYDGVIGDGNDVVGSRHWKYVCSQGVVVVEPCADYRNQICVQTNTFDVDGKDVQFRNAACIANNWRECINLNSKKDGAKKCEDTLNCRVDNVVIADHFNFDVCLPKYPAGFNLEDYRYRKTAEGICDIADMSCTVVYAPKTWGGCEIVANEGCLNGVFAEEMNDFCRGLGDCGGGVNIAGKYSKSYKIKGPFDLDGSMIVALISLSKPIKGQYAKVEDYSKYLEASGIWGGPEAVPEGEGAEDIELFGSNAMNIGMGAAGIGYAVGVYATTSFSLSGLAALATGPSTLYAPLSAFAGAAIGAGIGMIAGAMLAKELGLSPGGSLLMSIGGGMVGASLFLSFIGQQLWIISNPLLFWVGVIVIVVSLFFGGDDCDDVVVEFDCKTWVAPSGGSDCDKCNGNPLKPCSEYRCNSLGAACELINKGTDNELCVDINPRDVRPPILKPQLEVISDNEMYGGVTDAGFSLTSVGGGCIDAYTPLMFGIATDEPALCKFDIEMNDFDDMAFDLGGNLYIQNHTTVFTLPDPSHGQSQGGNWTGELTFYIKCQDTHGHESSGFYGVDMCVNEGPDKTAPLIRATSPKNGGIVGFNVSSMNVTIVTDELATCKWGLSDVVFSEMGNELSCLDIMRKPSNVQGYVCSGIMPTTDGNNVYYVRCEDQPWLDGGGNANVESFVYKMKKPSKMIEIDSIEPSDDFEINTEMTTIDLEVKTSGGGDVHYCSYSFSGYETMIEMFEGGGKTHKQPLNRPTGMNNIYIECEDETGDSVRDKVSFRIIRDSSTPQVARVWQDGGKLHVVTTEIADCRYSTESCMFNWDDGEMAGKGEEHIFSVLRGDTYYVKCEDEFGNVPAGCSITVRAL